jgi:hypothetical protein
MSSTQYPPPPPLVMSSISQLISGRYSIANSSGPPSEAPSSEISSVESDFSDLKSIIAGLGIVDPEEVYTERFKIDRLKLEDMIKSESKVHFINDVIFKIIFISQLNLTLKE